MTTYAVTSEVLEPGAILHVLVLDADLGEWAPESESVRRRTGTVTVRLVEVLVGRVTGEPGSDVTVDAVQRRPAGRRPVGFLGAWSHAPLDVGTTLVAFCDPEARTVAEALSTEHCTRLTLAGPILADLRLAAAARRRAPTADQLLETAERHRADAGALFARYVGVAAREALRTSIERFDRLMTLAEDEGTRIEAQEAYLVSAYEDLTFTGAFSEEHRARLARAMLRSALDPRLGRLRTQLLETYAPNLVTAPMPRALLPADTAPPELLDEVRTVLDDPQDPQATGPALRAWMEED